jgi:hypothetical protein
VLKLHVGLRKAESALLTQARTGKIGLAKFLQTERAWLCYSDMPMQSRAGDATPHGLILHVRSKQETLLTRRWQPDLYPNDRHKRRG